MSIISQAAVVLLIIFTAMIVFYANRGLQNAAEEGEHFVDEWELRRIRNLDHQRVNPYQSASPMEERRYQGDSAEEMEILEDEEEETYTKAEELPYTLTVYDGKKNEMQQLSVSHLPFTIGRDPHNDLILNDLYTARYHGEIIRKDGRLILRDLGTSNKIYVDGEFVSEVPLRDQAHFYVGSFEIVAKESGYRSQPTTLAARY